MTGIKVPRARARRKARAALPPLALALAAALPLAATVTALCVKGQRASSDTASLLLVRCRWRAAD